MGKALIGSPSRYTRKPAYFRIFPILTHLTTTEPLPNGYQSFTILSERYPSNTARFRYFRPKTEPTEGEPSPFRTFDLSEPNTRPRNQVSSTRLSHFLVTPRLGSAHLPTTHRTLSEHSFSHFPISLSATLYVLRKSWTTSQSTI